MTCSMPPPPVLITTAARSRCSGDHASKSSLASSTASFAAATAKWMKRLIRRAILRSMATVGTKSLTSAAIFTSWPVVSKLVMGPPPGTPARRFVQNVRASLPIGVTAPRPVTTARRLRSREGIGRIVAAGRRRPSRSVAVVALEDDRPVVAAEADVVLEGVADRHPQGLVDDPQVALGVGIAVV